MEIARAGARAGVRARAQRGVGQDVRAPRHRHHLPRQLRRRGGARPARGQPRLVLRRPRARPHLPGVLRGERLGLHARDGARARPAATSWRSPWRPWARCASAASACCPAATTASRGTRTAPTRAICCSSSTCSASRRWRRWWRPPGWAARSWGRPDELGQVKPGYLADLLLVDGDPLDRHQAPAEPGRAARDHEGRAAAQGAGAPDGRLGPREESMMANRSCDCSR